MHSLGIARALISEQFHPDRTKLLQWQHCQQPHNLSLNSHGDRWTRPRYLSPQLLGHPHL